MDAQSLLDTFGQTYHIPMTFNESNVCSAAFDDDVIDFELANNQLYLIASVAENIQNERVYPKLLEGNLDLTRTGGGFFAVDLEYKSALLLRPLTMPMEYTTFEDSLVHFLKAVRQWKTEIERICLEDTQSLDLSDINIIPV